MFLEPMVLSVILAKIRKGSFENIEKIEFNKMYLILIAGGIQLSLSLLKKFNPNGITIISDYFIYIHGFSYVIILYFALMNIKRKSMKLFLIGILLNFIVITFNGGKMPVSINGIKGINTPSIELPHREFDIKHIAVNENTKLVYLADIILIPRPYPLPKIISIGDVFLMLGLFLFIQEVMVLDENKNSVSQLTN